FPLMVFPPKTLLVFVIPIRALPALLRTIPLRALPVIVLKAIVALPPSTAIPLLRPLVMDTPPVRPFEPRPIWPLLPRPTKMFEAVFWVTVPPTTLPAELSVIEMPLDPFPLTVTGLTATVPDASCPSRSCELRNARQPVEVFLFKVMFVMVQVED